MRKNRWIIGIICIILCGACLAGAVAMKKGVSFLKNDDVVTEGMIRNPANIITPDMYELKDGTSSHGFYVSVNDDGVVSLLGDSATSMCVLRVASLTLPAGTYTFTHNDYTDITKYCMKVRTDDGNNTLIAPLNQSTNTFELEKETDVVIMLTVHEGVQLNDNNRHFYPILVPGDTAQDFYIPESSLTETAE